MNGEKELSLLIERARAYQEREHERNRKRIRNGFLCMLIIPTLFLILLFLSDVTGTSKLVMLVVWIVSMFVIASYLIIVDFMDYKLMHMMENSETGAEVPEEEQEDRA